MEERLLIVAGIVALAVAVLAVCLGWMGSKGSPE